MSIKDRAREFFDANPELFVVVELDGGRTESELDFHTRIATSFATVEREAAVREERAKIADELQALYSTLTERNIVELMEAYIAKLRGKEL